MINNGACRSVRMVTCKSTNDPCDLRYTQIESCDLVRLPDRKLFNLSHTVSFEAIRVHSLYSDVAASDCLH